MGVAPAGVEKDKTGHHHLLVDTTLSPEEMKAAIPVDDKHRHFGGGQTEAMVTLMRSSIRVKPCWRWARMGITGWRARW